MRKTATVAAVIGLLLAACGGTTPAASPTGSANGSSAPAGNEILVEGSISLTGSFADIGQLTEKTYRHYFDDLNKNGGLLGRQVKLVLNDDESDTDKAVALYQQYISTDKADLLVAPYGSPVMGEVLPIVEHEKMVMVQAGTAASSLLQGHSNKYTFTAFTFLDRDYTRPWVDWLKTLPADQRPKALAVFTVNRPFTLGIQQGLVAQAKDAGINVAVNEIYDANNSDFSALVDKAKEANADAVALLSNYPDSVLIAKAMADQQLKPKTWYNAISSTVPAWADLKDAGDSTMTPVQLWHTQKTAGIDQLLAWSKDTFKTDYIPSQVGATQTALEALTAGVKGCGKIDQDCIADWLHTNPVDTVSGQIKFDVDGIPGYSAMLVQAQKGQNVAIFPPEVAGNGKAVYPAP